MGNIEHGGHVDFSQRDIDLNYDWISLWNGFSNAKSFPKFVKESRRQERENGQFDKTIFRMLTFQNNEQWLIFLKSKSNSSRAADLNFVKPQSYKEKLD